MILLHTFPGKGPSNDTIYANSLHEAYRRQTEDRGGIDEHSSVAEPINETLSIEDIRECLMHYMGDPKDVFVASLDEHDGVVFSKPLLIVNNRKPSSIEGAGVELKNVPKRYLGHDVILCDEWFV